MLNLLERCYVTYQKDFCQGHLIEDCKDVEKIDLDELIEYLQIYEINPKRWDKKKTSIDLVLKHSFFYSSLFQNVELDSLNGDKIAMLTRNYDKFLKNT